ncbi:MAG: hypothetical protein M1816_000727 [Peltula sp. TS41687]|nr:MAG: hypothetical protein M1816_000727 [Peltula sp. TS41687]
MASTSSPSMGQPDIMTPRPASGGTPAPTPVKTPYTSLRQLAGLITKPSALGPSSGLQSPGPSLPRRTPSAGRYTPGTRTASRHAPIRRATPTTPHTIRALQQRRAAVLAVERTRRRSGRQHRETPRDTLRDLSRLLAKDSNPIESSPMTQKPEDEVAEMEVDDDFENDPELIAPRLSLPLEEDDDDDDDSFELPPEGASVHVDEGNLTQNSVELPRRAYTEQLGGRRSRLSFGSIRMSDRFAALDEPEIPESSEREDVGFAETELDDIQGEDEDEEADVEGEQIDYDDDINARDLGQVYSEDSARHESSIQSVPQPEIMDESTFAFNVPQRMKEASSLPEASPEPTLERPPEPSLQKSPESPEQLPQQSPQQNNEQPTQVMEDGQMEDSQPEPQVAEEPQTQPKPKPLPKKKELKVSRHGIPYPSLPVSVVKKLANTYVRSSGAKKPQLSKDTLDAVMEASDWFFEQVSDDLGAYARHAGRRMINESDMITLMKRQRQINAKTTPFSLAQRYLPRELVQEIRMLPTEKPRRRRRQKLEDVEEVDEEE